MTTLAPTEMVICTATYSVSQLDFDNAISGDSSAMNIAIANGTPPVGPPVISIPDTLDIPVTPFDSISIVKTAGMPSVSAGNNATLTDAGDEIEYTYVVTNEGTVNLTNITITDAGPSFMSVPGTNSLSNILCNASELAPGESTTCIATYTLSQEDIDNAQGETDSVVNIAFVTGTPPAGPPTISEPDTAMTTVIDSALITLIKSVEIPTVTEGADPLLSDGGDLIEYSFEVTNDGVVTLTNIVLSDLGPTFNGVAGDNIPLIITCAIDSLAPGESTTCTATYVMSQTDVNNAAGILNAVRNDATVIAEKPDGDTVTDLDSAFTSIPSGPMLTIEKSVVSPTVTEGPDPTLVDVGDTILYTYVVTNTGNVDLTNVVPVDAGPTFGGELAGGSLNAFVPTNVALIAPGGSSTFTAGYVLTQSDIDNGANIPNGVVNMATAEGMDPMGMTVVSPPDDAVTQFTTTDSLSIVKSADLTEITMAGDVITYSFLVTNLGATTLDNVSITDAGPSFGGVLGTNALIGLSCPLTTLAPTESTTCTATYTVSQADFDNAIVGDSSAMNIAIANGTPPVGPPVMSIPDTLDIPVTPFDSISIVKTAGLPTISSGANSTVVDAGDMITYTYSITNEGTTNLTNVSVSDAGPTFMSVPGTNVLSAITCNTDELAPGESTSCTATYTLSQLDIDNSQGMMDSVVNIAVANGTPPAGPPIMSEPDTAMTTVPNMPLLTINKTASAASVTEGVDPLLSDGGDYVDYTFEVTNEGNVTLTDVIVTDLGPLFNGTLGDNSPLVVDCGGTIDLAPGESVTCTSRYIMTQTDVNNAAGVADGIRNGATATGTTPIDTLITTPPDSAFTSVPSGPMLSLVKTASPVSITEGADPTLVDVGDTILYTYVVTNTGNVDLTNVVPVDAGPTFNTQPAGGTLNPFVPASVALLAPGASATFTAGYVLTQSDIDNAADIPGGVVNTAVAQGMDPMGMTVTSPPDDGVTQFSGTPALTVVKSADLAEITMAGDVITYSFEVTNTGNVTVDNVSITDAGPSFGGAAGTNSLQGLSCPLTTLAPTEMVICTATYSVSQLDFDNAISGDSSATNIATASGEPPVGPPVVSPPDTLDISVVPFDSISIVKTAGLPTTSSGANATVVDAGDIITYTYLITNVGSTNLTSVNVSDAGPSFMSVPGTNVLSAIICNTDELAPGESTSCTATYTLSQLDIDNSQGMMDSVVNIAVANGTPPAGPPITSEPDTAMTTVPNMPILTINKTASAASITEGVNPLLSDGGDYVDYTFEVTNEGNVTLTDVIVTDLGPLFNGTLGDNSPLVVDCGGTIDLAPGESVTCTSRYIMTQTDVNNAAGVADGIRNGATATGTTPIDTLITTPPDSAFTSVPNGPMLNIVKSASSPTVANGTDPLAVDVGDVITYTYVITNTGNVELIAVTPVDVGPTFNGQPAGGSLSPYSPAIGAILSPGAFTTFTATYTLTQVDIDNAANIPGGVVNTAIATGMDPMGMTVMSPPDDGITQFSSNPALDLEKTASIPSILAGVLPGEVDAGDTIFYSYVVTNTGSVTLDNISVQDVGPTFDGALGTNALQDLVCDLATLAPTEFATCTAYYILSATDINNAAGIIDGVENIATSTGLPPTGPTVTSAPDTATTTIMVAPEIMVTKTLVGAPSINADGTVDIRYAIEIENIGNTILDSIQVQDSLSIYFGVIDINSVELENFTAGISENSAFDGDTDVNTLTGDDSMNPGQTESFEIVINVGPAAAETMVTNLAQASGDDPQGNPVIDEDSEDVEVPIGMGEIGVAKDVLIDPELQVDGTYTLTYLLKVENTGLFNLDSVNVVDDLELTFPGITINNASVQNINGPLSPNPNYNGVTDSLAFTGDLGLLVGEMATFEIILNLGPTNEVGPFLNTAVGTAVDPFGNPVSDDSQDGRDPDPENDGPGDNSDPTPVTLTPSDAEIGVNKQVISIAEAASGVEGNFDVVFEITVENTDFVMLDTLMLEDDLATQWGALGTVYSIVLPPSLIDTDADQTPSLNAGFNGDDMTNLFIGTDGRLDAGQFVTIQFTVEIDASEANQPLLNTAVASADDPTGIPVSDDSQDGPSNDPEGDGPGDNNDPTPVNLPAIGIAKAAGMPVAIADQPGRYTIPYTFIVENTGNTVLTNVALKDDFATQLGGSFVNVIPGSLMITGNTGAAPGGVNLGYTGIGDPNNNMLDRTAILAPGDNITVTVSIVADVTTGPNPLVNQATAEGDDPEGNTVDDLSNDGTDVDGGDDPTMIELDCPLSIVCPADIEVQNDLGWCQASINLPEPTTIICTSIDPSTITITWELSGELNATGTGILTDTIFTVGTTTLTYTIMGTEFGAMTPSVSTCSFDITVLDKEAPIAVCRNVTAIVGADCDAIVDAASVNGVSYDNCTLGGDLIYEIGRDTMSMGATLTVTMADLENSPITIFLRVTDEAGNMAICSAEIEVEDDTPPTFDCTMLVDLTVNTEPGACYGLVPDFTSSVTLPDDNCSDALADFTITQSPLPGTVFGSQSGDFVNVVITIADGQGNEITCMRIAELDDIQPPVFQNCPVNITVANDVDKCGANVIFSAPVAVDNCNVTVTQTAGPISGSFLDVGMYNIEYTALDADGNTAICNFTLEVMDMQLPDIAGGFPADDEVNCDEIMPATPLTAANFSDNCPDPLTVDFAETTTQGGDPAACDFYDYEIIRTWTVTDGAGNAADFTNTLYVQDTVAPTFTLPASITISCDEVDMIPTLTDLSDNCAEEANITITMTDVSTQIMDPSVCGFYDYSITRTVMASDPCGNTTTMVQTIIVQDNNSPVIVCMDLTVNVQDGDAITLSGDDFLPEITDNCAAPGNVTVNLVDGLTISCDDAGLLDVTIVAMDPCGNESFCETTVTVIPLDDPILMDVPGDFTVNLPDGQCEATQADWPSIPTASGACDITITYDPNAIAGLPPGIHDVEVCATSFSGNQVCEMFTVTVNGILPDVGQLICNNQVNVSLGVDCTAEITADIMLPGDPFECYEFLDVIVSNSPGGSPIPGSPFVGLDDVGNTYYVTISHPSGGNSCWGLVTIEDKIGPSLACPPDITVACNQDLDDLIILGEPTLETCEDQISIIYQDDQVDNGTCGTPRAEITRTWKAIDGQGRISECVQIITVLQFDINVVDFPADLNFEDVISCDAYAMNVDTLDPLYTGEPSIDGMSLFGNHFCDVNIGYWDERLLDANCPGAFEILRHWVVRDECQPLVPGINPVEHIQSIKVEDVTAPTLLDAQDVTISTDLWGCSGSYELPSLLDGDNCSETETKWTYSDGFLVGNTLTNIAKGTTLVNAKIKDACGNFGIESFTITVLDQVAPVVVADEHTVVSLSQDAIDGRAKIYAETFDDGSFDGCGPVEFTVRRMDIDTICTGSETGTAQFDGEFQWYDFVHFCCNDVGNDSLRVIFRVCDDANMDGEFGSTDDYCNTAMVTVEVQDKLPPLVICPDDLTIDCIDFNALGDLVNSGPLSEEDVLRVNALFGEPQAGATCNYEITQTLSGNEFCGDGMINRNIIVTNTINGLTNSCTQEIDVRLLEANTLTCNKITFPAGSREAIANYNWCDPQDDLAPFVNTITVNNCEGGAFTEPIIDIDNLCTEAGINLTLDTFDFAGGGCKKILAHWEVIDQCVFQENFLWHNGETYEINPFVSENGYFELYIEYDIFDSEEPTIICNDDLILACDAYFAGPITGQAVDNCTEEEFLGWTWRLDLYSDGTFDGEGVGRNITAANAGISAGYFPIGVHEILWIVSDGCGNIATERCTLRIGQEDMKAPTPYCYDGIATAIMAENGTVEIWASDFDAGSFDDCDTMLTLTMIPIQDVELIDGGDSAVYLAAKPNWTFDCDYIANGVQSVIDVRMYVTDDEGNYDYCTATLRINDNFDVCEDKGGAASISGAITTETGDSITGVTVEINTFSPEYPNSIVTTTSGDYAFNSNPHNYDYEIKPSKDYDYRNGVSTIDLVLIQRHILGMQSLEGPYKMIAADVNSDCKVSAIDLLNLRKLILGLYVDDDLPNNESWRFVDKFFEFNDPEKPCDYTEVLTINNLQEDAMDNDFMGIKIGDVNGSAQLSSGSNSAEVRTNEALNFAIENSKVSKGERFEITFFADDFIDIQGYQFTFAFEPHQLQFMEIRSEDLDLNESNFGLRNVDKGLISTSWHSAHPISMDPKAQLFTLVFKSKVDGESAEMIKITSDITKAEAYTSNLKQVRQVALNDRSEKAEFVFDLFQNSPNPFNKKTEIGFTIPENNRTSLTIYNAIGELLYEYNEDLLAGEHSIILDRKELNGVGVLYYRLVSGENNMMKKMIVVD
ncbi:DUF7507 domain-containing protein [Portibacter lacus]|uniref:DUF7507 domain-containing protein n=1 Tax=Portibacter lacus TaxID=1099794 RepID=UPI0024E0F18F|nr:HYR domain-containing protein [Portibacter lacus]